MFKGIDLLTLTNMFKENDLVGHVANYFLIMKIKIEVYFYNLKKFGKGNICGLGTI